MKLDKIAVNGFKSIKNLDLELTNLNVLIGPNGAGKSNFISLFHTLNQIIVGQFQECVSKAGGAETFLHFGHKETEEICINLTFGLNQYISSFIPTDDDSLIFKNELILFHNSTRYSQEPYSENINTGEKESKLSYQAKRKPGKVASYVLNALENWRVYHFHDTSESSKLKKWGDLNDNLYLRPDARNLAAFLYELKETSEHEYQTIRDAIQMVAPFFDDFMFRPKKTNDGEKIRLEWREKGSDYPFLAHHFSDGTLRFICLATLLLQPEKPSTILIDEPELGLHPYAITILVSLMKQATVENQLIVSTQSVPLVNQMNPEDIIVVDREKKSSVFKRLSVDEIEDWIEDYGVGDLWEKNHLGGRP
jgi:predicted ATPase